MMFEEELFLPFYFTSQFFFRRHIGHIFCGKQLLTVVEDRILGDSRIGVRAKQYADSGIVVLSSEQIIIHSNIHIKLSDISMTQLMGLQFEYDKTLHPEVIEYKVYEEIVCICCDMLLSFHESKTSTEFKYKLLEIVNKRLFEFIFIEL